MKFKFSSVILAACSGLVAFGESATVESDSVETLGMIKTLKSSFTNEVVLNIPFVKSPYGETNTIDTLLVAGYGMFDSIHIWNPNQVSGREYDSWTYMSWLDMWLPADKEDGSKPGPAAETQIARGNAFWFGDAGYSFVDLVQAGLVKAGATTKVVAGSVATPMMSLLVNPYGQAFDIGMNITSAQGVVIGDQILPADSTVRYEYGEDLAKGMTGWGSWVKGDVIKIIGKIKIYGPDKFVMMDSFVMPAGKAFWYISKGGAPTVDWDPIK